MTTVSFTTARVNARWHKLGCDFPNPQTAITTGHSNECDLPQSSKTMASLSSLIAHNGMPRSSGKSD